MTRSIGSPCTATVSISSEPLVAARSRASRSVSSAGVEPTTWKAASSPRACSASPVDFAGL